MSSSQGPVVVAPSITGMMPFPPRQYEPSIALEYRSHSPSSMPSLLQPFSTRRYELYALLGRKLIVFFSPYALVAQFTFARLPSVSHEFLSLGVLDAWMRIDVGLRVLPFPL